MELIYNKEKYNVDIEIKDNIIHSSINGNEIQLPFRKITDNQIATTIDGKLENIYFAEDNNHIYIAFNGDNFIFDKVNEEDFDFGDDSSNNGDIDQLKPPMPGSVVKVLVEKGQKVKEGEGVIIVEAMKMETTLYSSIDGVVTEINVKQGEQVDSNQILIVIKKEE